MPLLGSRLLLEREPVLPFLLSEMNWIIPVLS
jgi:hypothetical protein